MIRVLIVDDSTIYRSQIRAALSGVDGVEVVGFASNGRLALEVLKSKEVDVITLDMEMPEMNGLETLAEIRKLGIQSKVIVFSSQSRAGAESALQALGAGAQDFLAKPTLTSEDKDPASLIRRHLLPKIQQFRSNAAREAAPPAVASAFTAPKGLNLDQFLPQALIIASSTGGPAALEKLFSFIAPPFSCPILIAQHMPPVFTATLAERLARICGGDIKEGSHGELIKAGRVYIAPGDYHMRVGASGGKAMILLDQGEQRNFVRPAADHLFESAANHYKNSCFGLVLTGMGADGKDGAVAVKEKGGAIMIQDRESCVVFGMPGAVHAAGAYDSMGPIEAIAEKLISMRIASNGKKTPRAI